MSAAALGRACVLALALAAWPGATSARAGAAGGAAGGELARKLANPLASLVSVPVQLNHDGGLGAMDAEQTTLNLQPVVPIGLGERSRWKLISRTVVPFVRRSDGGAPGSGAAGLGDVTQSVFVTPVAPTRGGWLVGAGPVVQLPAGSEPGLTTERWSAGPTAVAVRQVGAWAYGALANHLWSLGDGDGRPVSTTFIQPFVNYVTRTRTTFALNTEASRDWERGSWSVPVHAIVNQLVRVGPQPVSVFAGARYWAASPEHGAEGWGVRGGFTLLFVPARASRAGRDG